MKRAMTMGILGIGLVCGAQALASKGSSTNVTGVVNLNKASEEELKMLPGVKERAAANIVAHREKHPFTRVEELVNVKGFSKKRYERIKPFLTVGGDTTIRRLERKAARQIKKAVAPHHHAPQQ
jgi:competence protein ComEA